MNNVSQEIHDLIDTTGKAAPDMTQALKNIGSGSMQEGIRKLADYFSAVGNESGFARGVKFGEQSGWLKGSLSTLGIVSLAVGGKYIIDKYAEYKRKKAIEQEGQAILEAMKGTVPEEERTSESIGDRGIAE